MFVAVAKKPAPPKARKYRRVPSDDFVILINDEEDRPHAGEWIECTRSASIGELRAIWAFDRMSIRMTGDEEIDPIAGLEELDGRYDDLLRWMAPRIVAWNWTDERGDPIVPWNAEEDGQPYAKLDGSPEPLAHLSTGEIHYLRSVLKGETPSERGEG